MLFRMILLKREIWRDLDQLSKYTPVQWRVKHWLGVKFDSET